ncbi:hypothetical protein LCL95_04885 [Bacillus timonensis]|nr:hypothetical protein [Bacillus timonensis]
MSLNKEKKSNEISQLNSLEIEQCQTLNNNELFWKELVTIVEEGIQEEN